MANDDDKKAAFDHPCRETCSGWRQGFDRGQSDLREKFLKSAPEFDEAAAKMHALKVSPWGVTMANPDDLGNQAVQFAINLARWQHEQSRLREAVAKSQLKEMDLQLKAALAEVERLNTVVKDVVDGADFERDRLKRDLAEIKERLKPTAPSGSVEIEYQQSKEDYVLGVVPKLKRELAEAKGELRVATVKKEEYKAKVVRDLDRLTAERERANGLVLALEVVASNGEGRGMGWTAAQHARNALAAYRKDQP